MEKMDIAIAAAGAVVLVLAIAGSALYGGTGGSAVGPLSVTFPTAATELEPEPVSAQGASSVPVTFSVTQANLTEITFTVDVSDPSGAVPPSLHLTATSPTGETFEADGATLTVPIGSAPAATTVASEGDLPPPATNGTGEWKLQIDISSPAPLPVPYSGTASATVTSYAAAVSSDESSAAV